MARGWESKSVEAQIEANEANPRTSSRQPDAAELELIRKREGLLMSRTRILRDIQASHNERYQEFLQKSLVEAERRLTKLGWSPSALGAHS